MRRWALLVSLLVGFMGDGHASAVRLRAAVPIERRLEPSAGERGLLRTLDWWLG